MFKKREMFFITIREHGIHHRIAFWQSELENHPDVKFIKSLIDGLINGIGTGYTGPAFSIISTNWPSSRIFSDKVTEFVKKNLAIGAIEGPLKNLSTNFHCSPLGAFKRNDITKVRVIHDLSWPPKKSINDFISKDDFSMTYSTIDDAVKLCQKYSEPWLGKTDLHAAYTYCFVKEDERDLLGFSWDIGNGQEFFKYATIPFGIRSGPKNFDMFARGLLYIMQKNGVSKDSLNYLDDYLLVCDTREKCQLDLEIMVEVANKCGFKIQPEKTAGPSRVIEFLGIILDTKSRELRISEVRMHEMCELIQDWLSREVVSKRQLLSFIGKLSFCSKVIRDGFRFLRRLITLSKRVRNLHHTISLTNQAKLDILWWQKCIITHNGVTMFPRHWALSEAVLTSTDASDIAVSAIYGKKWAYEMFVGDKKWLKSMSIAYRELYAVLLCVSTFGEDLRNKMVAMYIDNQGMMASINSGKSKNPQIMSLIRSLYYLTTKYNIHYKAIFLNTFQNAVADSASRGQWVRFRTLHPSADVLPTQPVYFELDF